MLLMATVRHWVSAEFIMGSLARKVWFFVIIDQIIYALRKIIYLHNEKVINTYREDWHINNHSKYIPFKDKWTTILYITKMNLWRPAPTMTSQTIYCDLLPAEYGTALSIKQGKNTFWILISISQVKRKMLRLCF